MSSIELITPRMSEFEKEGDMYQLRVKEDPDIRDESDNTEIMHSNRYHGLISSEDQEISPSKNYGKTRNH